MRGSGNTGDRGGQPLDAVKGLSNTKCHLPAWQDTCVLAAGWPGDGRASPCLEAARGHRRGSRVVLFTLVRNGETKAGKELVLSLGR